MSFIEALSGFLTQNWLFVDAFIIYAILILLLDRRGTLSKYNITVYYFLFIPVLMIRTQKGQKFLDSLAVHKRFWRLFANLGLPAMLAGMIIMFLFLIVIDYLMIVSFQTQTVPLPSKFNEPRNIFLLPGINEFIPLWYGIIALVVTLVVHEFSHAILCKVEGIKVKSMGLLVALVPIGGFAEPDEEQLLGKKEEPGTGSQEPQEPKIPATRNQRVRVLTSGVMANFVTALIAFILFFSFLGSISPIGELMVTEVVPGSPADLAGVKPNMILTEINDRQINTGEDFLNYTQGLTLGSNVNLQVVDEKVRKNFSFVTWQGNSSYSGVKISNVVPGSAAESAGIKQDMVVIRINNTDIINDEDFVLFMNSTIPGQEIDIYLRSNNSLNASTVMLRNITLTKYPEDPTVKKGFLGISHSSAGGAISNTTGIGIGQFQAKGFIGLLKMIPSSLTMPEGWIFLFGLPFFAYQIVGFPGFSDMVSNFYEPVGMMAGLGDGIFWILNVLLWVGWMNFYVGLFNCLPAVPLDGGHVFRDVVASSLSKIFGNGEKIDRISNTIAILLAILILGSLLLVTFAPYAAHGF